VSDTALVVLSAAAGPLGDGTAPTLTLFNVDAFDFGDLLDPLGNRMLAQSEPADSEGRSEIRRELAAGTYYVAVSGAGNRYFHPFLADSGVAAGAGDYVFEATASESELSPSDSPRILAIDASALAVRVSLSRALDFQPTIGLYDDQGTPLDLAWTNVGVNGTELQMAPSRPLKAGHYAVTVSDALGHGVLATAVQVPETGDDASTGANDTPATARDLGGLASGRLVQVVGTIGDDPYYDSSTIDAALQPGNDVDMYHFRIDGAGRHGLTAEAFAGRIGSPLDVGISLFRMDPLDQHLILVEGSNQSFNPSLATNGMTPLFCDPTFSAGLEAGEYYLAVAHGSNTLSPIERQTPGADSGLLDPLVAHSGRNGWNVGPYVLNLYVSDDDVRPTVTESVPATGAILTAPPTSLVVTFSEPVNLNRLAFEAFQQSYGDAIPAIFLQDESGTRFFPRLTTYDPFSGRAEFQMLNRLEAGNYEWHISGAGGLADLAGNDLTGNDASGDEVIDLTVVGDGFVDGGESVLPTDVPDVRNLGVLFPEELQAGFLVDSQAGQGAVTAYRFSVLQSQGYHVSIDGPTLADGDQFEISLIDHEGNSILGAVAENGRAMLVNLLPGTYTLRVEDKTSYESGPVPYHLLFTLLGSSDNPPPLLTGPSPAIQVRLDSFLAPTPTPSSPQVLLPTSQSSPSVSLVSNVTVPGFNDGSAPSVLRHASWNSSQQRTGGFFQYATATSSEMLADSGGDVQSQQEPRDSEDAKIAGALDGLKDGPVGRDAAPESSAVSDPTPEELPSGGRDTELAAQHDALFEEFSADTVAVPAPLAVKNSRPVDAADEVSGSRFAWQPWTAAVVAGAALLWRWSRWRRPEQAGPVESTALGGQDAAISRAEIADLIKWSRRLRQQESLDLGDTPNGTMPRPSTDDCESELTASLSMTE
jgi:methionine-rich copper-binding protein CopC